MLSRQITRAGICCRDTPIITHERDQGDKLYNYIQKERDGRREGWQGGSGEWGGGGECEVSGDRGKARGGGGREREGGRGWWRWVSERDRDKVKETWGWRRETQGYICREHKTTRWSVVLLLSWEVSNQRKGEKEAWLMHQWRTGATCLKTWPERGGGGERIWL